MPKTISQIRISGLPANYAFKDWLQQALRDESDPLNYFSFANVFDGNENATNTHYSDLLNLLSNKRQSKKLIHLIEKAKSKFEKRKKNKEQPGFAKNYDAYWTNRRRESSKAIIQERQSETVIRLSDITCQSIEKLAQENQAGVSIHNNKNNTADIGSSSNNIINTSNPAIAIEQSLEEILSLAAELSSDKVGRLGVLDLGSDTVVSMLQEHLSQEDYSEIIVHASLPDIKLTAYAQELIISLCRSKLATVSIRSILYQVDLTQSFNLILNHDASFIETTVRHFLDLMDSPNNPLKQTTGERAACIHTIIYIMSHLFLANNDLVAFEWIESEYCQTSRCKWDGVLLKVNNKTVSPALIEFSGGTKVNNTINKESSDISKLYSNMINVVASLPASVSKKTFCARFHDDKIYFEELFVHKQKYYRKVHTSFRCPTTPRLLIEYIKQIMKILQWKEAIVNLTLEFEE